MGIAAKLRSIDGARPIAGASGSWCVSLTKMLTGAFCVDDSGEGAYAMMVVGAFSETVVSSVLRASRGSSARDALGDSAIVGVPCALVDVQRPYNAIGLWGYDVRPMLRRWLGDDMSRSVVGVFPAYDCEFGREDDLEIAKARLQVIDPGALDRNHQPYFRMRYRNDRTGGRSAGGDFGVTRVQNLLYELREIKDSPGFVDLETKDERRFRVEWDGSWVVNGSALAVDDIAPWVTSKLHASSAHDDQEM